MDQVIKMLVSSSKAHSPVAAIASPWNCVVRNVSLTHVHAAGVVWYARVSICNEKQLIMAKREQEFYEFEDLSKLL